MTDPADPQHSSDREYSLFTRAKALPPDERRAFVEREAAGDLKLRRAVLSLLGEPVDAAPPLGGPAVKVEPQVTIILPTGSSDAGAWQRYLDQLHSRGPAFERYVFKGEVARGGMGVIHRVFDQDARRHLALKVLLGSEGAANGSTPQGSPVDSPVDSRSLGRFLEEAQVTSQLDHPGIVPVHEIGVDCAGRVYFTMKLVKGETLKEVFSKVHANHPDWSFPRALSLVLRVCEAMSYAHAKGVLHRDLKPANVMVGKFGEVYVMDWGLARVMGRAETKDVRIQPDSKSITRVRTERHDPGYHTPDSPLLTMDGDVVGTPAYMPPEQAKGLVDQLGPTADVYGLGAVLYHLIAGHPPYGEDREARLSPRTIHARVIDGPPKALHTLKPETPAELIAICEKAMARDAKARYPSMDDFAQDLRAYLDHRVVAAYETGAIAELKKWVQRNPALAATAGVLVLVLAGSIAVVTRKNAALGQAHAEITAQKSEVENQKVAVEAKSAEVSARKAEFDQLAGKVYLERAIEREKDLYPPWPEKIAAMERWLVEDAKRLLDLKPTLESTLADLRARALPISDAERERDRTTHPQFAELESLRPRLAWLRSRIAALAAASSPTLPTLPADLESKTAGELNDFAWKRVDPDFAKRIFGEEPLALAAAQRAIAKIEAGDSTSELGSPLDTLAWALFANGRDTAAREASARALAVAPENKKADYRTYTENLEKAIAAHSGAAGAKLLADLEAQVSALETAVNARQTFTLALESETFLYTTLSDLAASIASFESGAKHDVEQRLDWAKKIGDLTLRHPNARVTWEEARAAILKADDVVASKLYAQSPGGPIELTPQTGLVPIGMNPVTKLWEFYELRSACDIAAGQDPAALEIPTHREDGSIEVKDGTGIVFVLLPGDTFLQGAQKTDENAPNYDPRAESDESLNGKPVSVTLAPFFLARHETTQGQWLRLSLSNPSYWMSRYPKLTGLDRPIESVPWRECSTLFRSFGLDLPTEARWEYACRAGTTSVFSFGADDAEIVTYGNVRDVAFGKTNSNTDPASCDPFDDGQGIPCSVGHYASNAFGLYDMHGNVWEWCQDAFGPYSIAARDTDGLREPARAPARASVRVSRGGGCRDRAVYARSARRARYTSDARDDFLGVRIARNLNGD